MHGLKRTVHTSNLARNLRGAVIQEKIWLPRYSAGLMARSNQRRRTAKGRRRYPKTVPIIESHDDIVNQGI